MINRLVGFAVYWTCLAVFTITHRITTAHDHARRDLNTIRRNLWPNPHRPLIYTSRHSTQAANRRRLRATTSTAVHRTDFDLAGGQ